VVKATFLGHAAVSLESDGKTLLIDPFLTGNPVAAAKAGEVSANAIFLTHGHGDHLGDGLAIAKRTGCTIVACYELAAYCQMQGATTHAMHIGGKHDFGWFTLKLTPALHGSAVVGDTIICTGNPTGGIITMGGKTVYHPGDTGLTAEMEVIGRLNSLDLAFLPIGDNFTMGIDDAVEAVRMLKPVKVVPIHYDTFDLIRADPAEFAAKVGSLAEVVVLRPGDSVSI
jgi:L-ascorbate metabolism protein UlaG (beta-lactamase superfamily)